MRRPRSKLQVSTFPFLAVLLCAMGSLLLLLFIMDRRAKIAAQNNAMEASAKREERTKAQEDARQAEWEKARDALRLSLLEHHSQLLDQSKAIDQDAADAEKRRALANALNLELQGLLGSESDRIGSLKNAIAEHETAIHMNLQEAMKKEATTSKELLEANRELAELERAFRQLQALRERDKQIYSVVPYRGKRGDMRPPVYVECVRDGLLFHPDKKVVRGLDLTPESVRVEVESRSETLVAVNTKGKRPEKSERKGPYVLFLVRPDGIGAYYMAQSALKGFEIDFGYELIDTDWALEFNNEALAKNTHSKSSGVKTDTPKGSEPEAKGVVAGSPSASGGTGKPGGTPNGGTPNDGTAHGGSPVGGTDPRGPGVRVPPWTGYPSIGAKGPAFVPIGKGPSLMPIASSDKDSGRLPVGNGGVPNGGASTGTGDPTKSTGETLDNVSPIKGPIPGNSVGGARPTPKDQGNGGGEPDRTAKPIFGAAAAEKKPPTPLSKLIGNKDFVITVECHETHAVVLPSGQPFRWATDNGQSTDAAFAQAVTNLIAKRQASVRPGEPRYRPIVRFEVSPDGQRTYLRAYPLLEHLNLPMTRENIRE